MVRLISLGVFEENFGHKSNFRLPARVIELSLVGYELGIHGLDVLGVFAAAVSLLRPADSNLEDL